MQIQPRSRSVKMVGKANRSKSTQKFGCPFCQKRLWHLGSQKYYLGERDSWLETFFCEEHGEIWMRLSKTLSEAIVATAASSNDWHRIQARRGQ